MKRISEFRRIWVVDFEFGEDENLLSEVRCIAARELRSSKVISRWLGEEAGCLNYPFRQDDLYIAYAASAEMSCHLALGWPTQLYIL